jgi:MinD-like ATPase involved in chromosome partitioning or flagellar assembly
MTTIAFVSAKGSPGVTATVLALGMVWPQVERERSVLIADCDPAGSNLATGYLRDTVDPSRGLIALAARPGHDPVATVWGQLSALDEHGRQLVLPGLLDMSRAAALDAAFATLTAALERSATERPDLDVLLDCGRLGTAHDPLAVRRVADLVVLVTRSSFPAVVAARAAAGKITEETARAGCMVVGPGRPYSGREIADVVGLPLLGEVPHDPDAAVVFSEGRPAGRRHPRSPLVRAARLLVTAIRSAATAEPALTVAQTSEVVRG